MRARELLNDATRTLKASETNDHWQASRERIEAEELLGFVLGHEPDPREEIPKGRASRFLSYVDRRAKGEPVPYIKGFTDFRGLDHLARHGVFVPRDSSEFLAEQAIRRLRNRRSPVAVDLATGGGTIAIAIANEVPRARVFGSDVSKEAVALARANARRFGLQARFFLGDLFGALPTSIRGTVDVITLHPPYVPAGDVKDLPDEIRDWEPVHTLTDNSRDGLGLIGRTVTESPDWLRPGGWLLMEVSPDRTREVSAVFRAGRFRDVRSTKGGPIPVTRVVVGRLL